MSKFSEKMGKMTKRHFLKGKKLYLVKKLTN